MKKLMAIVLFLTIICQSQAQEHYNTTSAGVIALESRNLEIDPVSLGNILRNELIKIELFTVIDRYETRYALEEVGKDEMNCYGKTCLVEVGTRLGVEKMIGGAVDLYGGNIVISIRTIDVASASIEHNYIEEFIDVEENIPAMIGLCLRKMYDLEVNEDLFNKMTNENDYESTMNTPDIQRLSLSGPRMGFGMVTGMDGEILTSSKGEGGFDAWPVLSQFGYQFEFSYLNQGNVQALFEIVPTVAGLEQGLFIPSLSILHGVRSNINGLEFAFGPVFFVNQKAEGFELNGQWYLEEKREEFPDEDIVLERRLDSRGDHYLDSGLVLAVGRTFRSGKVNFPVNIVTVLKKSGIRVGLSFGFNASSRDRK